MQPLGLEDPPNGTRKRPATIRSKNSGIRAASVAVMDPIGFAVRIADVALNVVAALENLDDIEQDSLVLRKLVLRVDTVVKDASNDFDSGSLSKPGTVSALEVGYSTATPVCNRNDL